MLISAVFPPELQSARAARRWLAHEAAQWAIDRETVERACLLVSELVANGVLHGRSQVTVTLRLFDSVLTVSVADEDSRRPVLFRADDSALGGRGLTLVEQLADSWGVADQEFGKAVWFRLAVDPVPASPSADPPVTDADRSGAARQAAHRSDAELSEPSR
ncbi:MAG: ATP-binding protein [Actinomycetota bacterium]|nr:ATP-binding protein [Actinomycetota bacterium]